MWMPGSPNPLAGLPAMVDNDNACEMDNRGALESIADKPAPAELRRAPPNNQIERYPCPPIKGL
jgi:hypothetical protein